MSRPSCRELPLGGPAFFFCRGGCVDGSITDFAIIETELEAIYARLARMATRADLARAALGIISATTGLMIGWIEVFRRHRL